MTGPVIVASLAAGCAAAWLAGPRVVPALPDRSRTGTDRPETGGDQTVVRVRLPVAVLCAFGVSLLVGGPAGWVAGAAAGVIVWRVVGGLEPAAVRRRREALERGLPHVVDLLACCLSAGASPMAAVDLVARTVAAPMSDELDVVARRLQLGVEPVRVWRELRAHPQWGPLGRSLAQASETGASVSEAMHRLAEDLRRAMRSEVEARARGVGVRAAAPLGLCLLPAFVLVGVVPLVAASTLALFAAL